MKRRLPNSPARLPLLALLSCLIAPVPFLLPWSWLNHSWLFGPCLIFCCVVPPACAILPLKFVTDLRHGVENERWTDAQLEPLRAYMESRYYTALSIGLLVAYDICLFLFHQRFEVIGGVSLFYYFLLFQFRLALRRPPSSTQPDQWHNAAPIHSDHRGNR